MKRHELAVSKLVAGREKDRVFLAEMSRHGMIDGEILLERIARLDVSADEKTAARERWQRISGSDG